MLVLLGSIGVAAVFAYGDFRWKAGTRRRRDQLDAARLPHAAKVLDPRELELLPEPVQRYFRAVLAEGQPIVAAVRLEQAGTFNMNEATGNWKPFTSTQHVVTCRAGFDWDARITMMPGLTARVHDAYIAGEGFLHAAVYGLVSMVNMRGSGDMARGELMRFFAESPWYPTALLPSQGIVWSAVDQHSAHATLRDGELKITLLFRFNAEGLIDAVHAEARGRTSGGNAVSMPWEGRFWNYAKREGMRVPLEAEAAWIHPDGAKPYWRGQITQSAYEFAH